MAPTTMKPTQSIEIKEFLRIADRRIKTKKTNIYIRKGKWRMNFI